jgi:hypothetical protein
MNVFLRRQRTASAALALRLLAPEPTAFVIFLSFTAVFNRSRFP